MKKLLKFKVMLFPDGSSFNVLEVLIGCAALALFTYLSC